MDVIRTGWQQEGHLATKTPHQFPLMECTFPALLFLHGHPPVREGHGGMALKTMNRKGESRGNWLNQVHQEGWPLSWHVCECA